MRRDEHGRRIERDAKAAQGATTPRLLVAIGIGAVFLAFPWESLKVLAYGGGLVVFAVLWWKEKRDEQGEREQEHGEHAQP